MNYRHVYHAGNFADVFKHIVLVALTKGMLRKEKGFCFLDTHAGVGFYDLKSEQAQKSQEFQSGIEKIWQATDAPELVQAYLACVKELNTAGSLRYYPGSPAVVREFLRHQDRMVLTELQPDDYQVLKDTFYNDKLVSVHHQDAYQALKALLPPKERRGLVLIDPPYEQPDELMQMITTLSTTLTRWETGVYALWYPIKEYRSIERFHHSIQQRIEAPVLCVELSLYPENLATHLNGSGMLIINPPWQIDEELKSSLEWLWKALSTDGMGRHSIKWLVKNP
jgi:23S rRNA (adenine2030-N6)-methyltransferase